MHRHFPSILALLLVLSAFIAIPLMGKPSHPLTSADNFDLCRKLQDGAVQSLPVPPLELRVKIPGFAEQSPPQPSCFLPMTEEGAETPRHIWVVVITQRNLSQTGNRQKTDAYVDTWLKETAASGYAVTPIQGSWRRAAVYHNPVSPQTRQLLADDDGVVLWFSALNLEASALQAFAEATVRRLRESPS